MTYLKTNRDAWNQRVATHVQSKFYDVSGFLAGNSSLKPIELAAMPHVQGQTLLHLQCHFGLDSLSWARMGAQVTGVDISDVAIDQARKLQQQTGLDARFMANDVYQFGATNQEQYDWVFTSYGAICWLPDLNLWAQTVANSLASGGSFFMVEFHPVIDLLSGFAYFHQAEPDVYKETTYTENAKGSGQTVALWSHPIGDVINALLGQGLVLVSVNEHDHSPFDCFTGLVEQAPGRHVRLHEGHAVPLLYSIMARKP